VEYAIRSVLSQSRAVDEIIVVDDGSTDATAARLPALFGDRVRYVRQSNAGVSAARNHGLRLARGRYLAFLDDDDEWLPDKTRQQWQWLEAHPDFGMVLCDVMRMNPLRLDYSVLRRRQALPEDGHILKWVLMDPSLTPSSVMLRRSTWETVGGFDEALPTAEDIDFHLRVAARCKIGLIEEPLVRSMRGHAGLSSLTRTYGDYIRVIESAAAAATGLVAPADRARALARAYARNARGLLLIGHRREAWLLACKAWRLEPDATQRWRLWSLVSLGARAMFAGLRKRPGVHDACS